MSSAAIPSTVCSQTRCRKPGKGDGGGYLPGVNRSSCRRGTPPCRCPDADGRACLMPLPAPPQVFLWRQPDKARPAEAVPDACMGDDPGPSHHPAHRGSNGECTAHTALVWETIQDPVIILLIVAATVSALRTLHLFGRQFRTQSSSCSSWLRRWVLCTHCTPHQSYARMMLWT